MEHDRTINEYVLKVTGGVYLGGELDPSLAVNLKSGTINIYEVSKRDNQDGTFDVVYKGKFVDSVDYEQKGQVVRGRDKTHESKKTRYAILCLAQELNETEKETFYKIFQEKLRANLYEVWQLIQNK